jgi:hypothetical protein
MTEESPKSISMIESAKGFNAYHCSYEKPGVALEVYKHTNVDFAECVLFPRSSARKETGGSDRG